jgi:outer membrane lipoprotein-sorting protein
LRKIDALPLVLLLLLAHRPVAAGATLLQEVRERMRAVQPFRVDFVQQVFIDGVKEAEEKGQVLFRDANALKWEYTSPERKIFLLLDDRYQFYQPENQQVLRGRLDKQREKLLWQLLATEAPSTGYSCDEKRRSISIRSQSDDGPIDLVVFLGADGLPVRAEQTDPSGVQQVLQFFRYRIHLRTTPAYFILAVPRGTEIIDE